MEVLSIKGLTKRYDGFLLDGVSLRMEKGEIMGFIGRNGAGKTTTLRTMLGFVHPDSGEVRFFGMPFSTNELAIKQRTGFVSGGIDFYMQKKLSVITSVTRRFYPGWDDVAYRRYMSDFGLDENKKPCELSAGMKVKYNLALALSHRAELLILDEPTSGLDPVSREELLDIMNGLCREGVSILFSTHITSDLEKCADTVTYIKNGRITAQEKLADFSGGYMLLEFADGNVPVNIKPLLIGLKPAKHGCTALIRTSDAAGLSIPAKSADLDTIMVHLERGE